ncbi:MAG: hypothetical protein QF473_37825 [Planctomycetota bacterium]|jgi:hypothetical protein|nr:hypothetical protein [Planctomycetota bacterium]MDP6503174.1 hypothetical protein [Planctomycetota bacterium]
MSHDHRAEILTDVAAQATTDPLELGDKRYVDMSAGRESDDLKYLRMHIEDRSAEDNQFAKVAFTGHRGCGKTTELYRLERDLGPRFLALHLSIDNDLLSDCKYTDLLLWLTESLVERSCKDPRLATLDAGLVKDVTDWFTQETLETTQKVKSEIELTAQAEPSGLGGSLGLLARVKSMVQSSVEHRRHVRRVLQSYGAELVRKVNLLLDNAHEVLGASGITDLLIVQDNLEKMPAEPSKILFFDHGDLLKQLRAHVIYTVPIAMILAPWDIGKVFDNTWSMPMVKTSHPSGEDCEEGINALVGLLDGRVVVNRVFESRAVAEEMVRFSGGSVRDLIRLLNTAQMAARVDGKTSIDIDSVKQAVKKMRIEFERLLIPGSVYYPLLARVHRSKSAQFLDEGDASPDKVQADREFFSQLLFNASVMEYNGERSWYDVHPIITQIEEFKDATDEQNSE